MKTTVKSTIKPIIKRTRTVIKDKNEMRFATF